MAHRGAHPGHPQEEWRGEVVRLSWKPRAFLWKKFLSDEECDHLVTLVCGVCGCVYVCAVRGGAAGWWLGWRGVQAQGGWRLV